MEPRSTHSAQDWQDYLKAFEQEASSKGFATYLENIKAHGQGQNVPIPIEQFAPLQVIVLIQSLSRAALLACVQLPPDAVGDALARVIHAAQTVNYGPNLPGKVTTKEKQIYQRIRPFIPKQLSICGTVLKAVFECYASGDYDAAQDADEIMREARGVSEKGDSVTALHLIGRAGAVALRTKIIWSGWTAEGNPEFRSWAHVLHNVLECLQDVVPLGDVDTERLHAERVVTAFAAPLRDKPAKQRIAWKEAEPEEALALVELAGRDQPFTDDEIQQMGSAYDRQVEIATTLLEGRHRIDMDDDRNSEDVAFEATKDFAVALGIRALGLLRPQKQYIVEQLIDVIVDACADEDLFAEPPQLEAAVFALGHIGQPSIQPCIEFLRYSSQHQARFQVADALGVAGRGNEEAFQTLFALAQQTHLDLGKIVLTGALARLHDDRAIPWMAELAQALAGPDVIQLSDLYEDIFELEADQFELMDALHELNAIEALDPEPNPDRYLEEGNDDPGAVIVRGYGRIARAVPANWDYPDRRPVGERTDYDDDEFESVLAELDTDIDKAEPPFMFTPPPKPQPIVNTNKVGRNDPCPCGSGKKYKHCHGKN